MNNGKKKLGRPSKRSEVVAKKLEQLFQIGVSDEVACRGAKITKPTFYQWCKEDKEFLYRIQTAKDYARIASGSVVLESIVKNRNTNDAKWWLERKHSDEFASRPDIQVNQDNRQINLLEGGYEKLAQRLARLVSGSESVADSSTLEEDDYETVE